MTSSKPESKVAAFYANCNVFITGASGYLGKVLVEKLLRSCPDVAGLYLLIRRKKDVDIEQRLVKLTESSAFDVLRIQKPNFAEKLHPIMGDIEYEDLALHPDDRKFLIKHIDIVFNVAATIRFDEKLKKAVNMNVRGTLQILNLCEQMEHLKAIIHTSTAYSHCYRKKIEESFYPTPFSPDTILKFVTEINNDTLNKISSSLLTQGQYTWPNNYTFTKAIAEELIRGRQDRLPIAIVRPSIVNCTYKEPTRVWCDNMYGVVGFQAAGLTLMNVCISDKNCKVNMIPADYCMNAHIAAAEHVAMEYKNNVDARKIIFNCIASDGKCITIGENLAHGLKRHPEYPMHAYPYPYFVVHTRSKCFYTVLKYVLHYIPGLLFDIYCVAIGKQTRYIKYYKMINKFSELLAPFLCNSWDMTNHNLRYIFNNLNETDKEMFPFDIDSINMQEWLDPISYGIKKYLLKDSMDERSLQADRNAYKRMVIFLRVLRTGFYLIAIYYIYYLYTILF